jgi:hypothetical protein
MKKVDVPKTSTVKRIGIGNTAATLILEFNHEDTFKFPAYILEYFDMSLPNSDQKGEAEGILKIHTVIFIGGCQRNFKIPTI